MTPETLIVAIVVGLPFVFAAISFYKATRAVYEIDKLLDELKKEGEHE